MIDYIPPDIPPAIVEYVHEHNKNLPEDVIGHWFKYITIWKGDLEVYATNRKYKSPEPNSKTGENKYRIVGIPSILIYNCHDVRKPTITEVWDIHWFMPKYLYGKNIKSEHLCHRDLPAFNQHNTPNPYKQKAEYHTPMYIPKPVKEYANQMFPISWYPGLNHRYIKYLDTYENKYEVYYIYWKNTKGDVQSGEKYILYDCEHAREYQNNKERVDLSLMHKNYNSNIRPIFCKSK